MKKTGRKSLVGLSDVRSSIENYSTKFSSPKFVKRVEALTNEQKIAIEKTGFGNLLRIPTQTMNRKLLLELMDRWSSERRAFVLPQGELTLTLLDVVLIMGLRVSGDPVILKDDEPFSDLEREFGATSEKRKISLDSIESRLDSLDGTVNDDFVRSFLLFTFGVFLFPDSCGNVDSRYLSFLRSVDDFCKYAWGSAVLDEILMWLSKRKDSSKQFIGGCLTFLQIWSYEHLDLARPGLVDSVAFPRACRWESRKHNPRQSISINLMFDELTNDQIICSLEPTSYELELIVAQELMEVHSNGNKLPGARESSPTSLMVVKSEIFSDDFRVNGVKPENEKQLLQPWPCELPTRPEPSISLECATTSSSSLQSDHVEIPSTTSQGSSMGSPASNVSNLILKNLKLKERVSELEKQIDCLKLENAELNCLKLENAVLKKEVDDLRRENRATALSSNDFICRLEKVLSGDSTDDGEGT